MIKKRINKNDNKLHLINVASLLVENIFGNSHSADTTEKIRIKRNSIFKTWLSRRIINNKYSIVSSKLFGDESVILTDPHLEYRAIFESIITLKYRFVVSVNTITLFSDPTFESEELIGCSRPVNEIDGNGIFSIPLDLLDKEDMILINLILTEKKFKDVKKMDKTSPFCTFIDLDSMVAGESFKRGSNVHLKYKQTILSGLTNEIINVTLSDSMRISHIILNKTYGSCDAVNTLNVKKKYFILRNHYLRIMRWIFSYIYSQIQIIVSDLLEYNNVMAGNKFVIMKKKASSRIDNPIVDHNKVGLCIMYKNTLELIKEIIEMCEAYIKINNNK